MTAKTIRMALAATAAMVVFGFSAGLRPTAGPAAAASNEGAVIEVPSVCVDSFERTAQGVTGHLTLVVANVGAVPAQGAVMVAHEQSGGSLLRFQPVAKGSLDPGRRLKFSATFTGVVGSQAIWFWVMVDPDPDVPYDSAYGRSAYFASPKDIPRC